jgi:heme/copper-type cytochrome/quinol oxidase subunit 2
MLTVTSLLFLWACQSKIERLSAARHIKEREDDGHKHSFSFQIFFLLMVQQVLFFYYNMLDQEKEKILNEGK